MKKLILSIVAILIIILGGIYLFKGESQVTKPVVTADESAELVLYFTERVMAHATSTFTDYQKLGLGDAIDGFTLLKLYPNLVPADFANVIAYQGEYSVQNGKLTYTGHAASNSAVLLEQGMSTLLKNVSARLNIPVTTKADVDAILAQMNTNQQLTAKLNQIVTSRGIYITPLEVIEDSRCPANANCIQAGTVKIKTLLESASGKSNQVFELNKPVTTETREITLVQVDPQSQSGRQVLDADYVFYFEIKNR